MPEESPTQGRPTSPLSLGEGSLPLEEGDPAPLEGGIAGPAEASLPKGISSPLESLGGSLSMVRVLEGPMPVAGAFFKKKLPPYGLWFYGMVFLESCVLPLPPDPFFILYALKTPKKVWSMALKCTTVSTLGGCLMYGVGFWFYEHYASFFMEMCGGEANFSKVRNFMDHWGGWALLAKSFTPVPYKLMALISGITHFSFGVFAATSLMARAVRFFGVAFFVHRYHHHAQRILDRYSHLMRYALYALGCVFLMLMLWRTLG